MESAAVPCLRKTSSELTGVRGRRAGWVSKREEEVLGRNAKTPTARSRKWRKRVWAGCVVKLVLSRKELPDFVTWREGGGPCRAWRGPGLLELRWRSRHCGPFYLS